MSGQLEHSPAKVIQQMLIDLGHGTAPSDSGTWPIFVAHIPDAPDSVIVVYDTAARDNGREMIRGERQEHHGFQVMVRDATYNDGYAKARAIAVALDEDVSYTGVTISTTGYVVYAVSRTSDVIALGAETPTSKRDLFTVNAVAAMRQS